MSALENLPSGELAELLVSAADRAETIGAVIDGWLVDFGASADTIMVAWRSANVESLNHLGGHALCRARLAHHPHAMRARARYVKMIKPKRGGQQ